MKLPKIVRAHFCCTRSNTVTSTGPVASSSVRKMIRCWLRTSGVCEETFTPATITHSRPRLRRSSVERTTPRSSRSGS
jgi:hypothetical protein